MYIYKYIYISIYISIYMVFTTEGLLEVARRSNHLSYQAMSSTATQSQLCTATPIVYVYIHLHEVYSAFRPQMYYIDK